MLIDKALYYAQTNWIEYIDIAPSDNGNGPELTGPHSAAILAIPDDDPGFIAWYNAQQDIARKSAYTAESDPIYLNEIEHAHRNNISPDLTAWLAKKDEIRVRFAKTTDIDVLSMKAAASDGVDSAEESQWSANALWAAVKRFFGY